MKAFFLLFILIPLFELFVLIEVGGAIGAFPTILLTVFTALMGVHFMRSQGLAVMQRMQVSMGSGQAPATELIEGVMIFIGGVFLLLPGLVSDTLGLLFLVPPVREWLASRFLASRQTRGSRGFQQNVYDAEWHEKPKNHLQGHDTIEGEFVEKSDKDTRR